MMGRADADNVSENLQMDFRQEDECAMGSEFEQSRKWRRKK